MNEKTHSRASQSNIKFIAGERRINKHFPPRSSLMDLDSTLSLLSNATHYVHYAGAPFRLISNRPCIRSKGRFLFIIRDYAGEIPGIMKVFVIFTVLLVGAVTAEEYCYKDVVRACKPTTNKQTASGLVNCNAKYGAIEAVMPDLQRYVNTHIKRSFEFLLMSTHYANYEKNREGFEKLFRGLSDSTWNDAIELIKYLTKRGGEMNFSERKSDPDEGGDYELYELQSIAKALDIEKELATDAHAIHGEATRRRKESHDPEISAFIEEEFVHKHAKTIRELSGYTADLKRFLSGPDSSLALYLFDDYLQKQ